MEGYEPQGFNFFNTGRIGTTTIKNIKILFEY